MTKHILRHAISVGALAFMWVEVLDLVGHIGNPHTPLAVLAVAASIGITIYVLTMQIPLLAKIRKREMEAGK